MPPMKIRRAEDRDRELFIMNASSRKALVLQEFQVRNKMSLEGTGKQSSKNVITTVVVDKTEAQRPVDCKLYPDILIIGFEKCGTMTLRSYLASHPEIFITKSNLSIPYFNSLNYTSFEEFTKNVACTPRGKLRLEKISTHGRAEKAHERLPDIKLLAIVREPVERAMSHHLHRIARNKETAYNFDVLIESLLNGHTKKSVKTSVLFRQSTYIIRLQQWIQTYGISRIHIVDGDNFIKNPAFELKKVEQFLGILPHFSDEHFVYNPVKRFYCLKLTGNDTNRCMNGDKGRPHPEMSTTTRKRLQQYFKPFNEKLFVTLGRNFSWIY